MRAAARCIRPAPTHRQLTEEQLEEAGVGIDLVARAAASKTRPDIIADLDQALAAVQ